MSSNKVRHVALLCVVVVLTCAVWSQAPHSHKSDAISSSNWSELQASMEKMHSDIALVDTSGDCDVDFVRLMIPHHKAAIDMAKTLLANGKDPQMRRLAQEVITDQQSEIELMQLWLKGHDHRAIGMKIANPQDGQR